MTVLWICLAVLIGIPLLLALLLWMPAIVILRFDCVLTVKMRVLGIPITLYDGSSSRSQNKQRTAPSSTQPAEQGRNPLKERFDSLQKALKKDGIFGYIELCRTLAGHTGTMLRRFERGTVVRRLRLFLTLAADEPDKLALQYGRVCAALATAQTLLTQTLRVKRSDVRVTPDFLADDTYFYLDASIRVCPLRYLFAVGGAFFRMWGYTNSKIETAQPSQHKEVA